MGKKDGGTGGRWDFGRGRKKGKGRSHINPRLHRRPPQQRRRRKDEQKNNRFIFAGIAFYIFMYNKQLVFRPIQSHPKHSPLHKPDQKCKYAREKGGGMGEGTATHTKTSRKNILQGFALADMQALGEAILLIAIAACFLAIFLLLLASGILIGALIGLCFIPPFFRFLVVGVCR